MDSSGSVPRDVFITKQEGRLMMNKDIVAEVLMDGSSGQQLGTCGQRAGSLAASMGICAQPKTEGEMDEMCKVYFRTSAQRSARGTVTGASEQTSAALQPGPLLAPDLVFSIHHCKMCLPNREG